MNDRAQFTTPGSVRLLVGVMIGAVVLVIVVEEMLSMPAVAAGEVDQVCGLCHVEWRRNLTALGIITGLVVAANWLLGGPKWPPEEDGDE